MSQKYHIDKCKATVQFLRRNHTADNVCQVLQLAILFDQTELKESCEDFISENTEDILHSGGFLSCDKAILDHILKLDKLSCPETVIFEACIDWVKKASNQQNVTKELIETHLRDSFYQILFRYDSIVRNFFLGYCEILQMIANEQIQPKLFNGNRREKYEWNEKQVIFCNRAILDCNGIQLVKEVVTGTFTSNKPLLFSGFKCYKLDEIYKVSVTVTRQQNQHQQPKVLYQGDIQIEDSYIVFAKPVLIRPGIEHEIHIKANNALNTLRYTPFVLRSEVQMRSDTIVRFSKDQEINDHLVGCIIALLFN